MLLIDASPLKVLNVLFSSTARKFYTSEVVHMSGLSWPTVLQILKSLEQAAMVIREQESWNQNGQPRVFYSLTPLIVESLTVTPRVNGDDTA